MPENPPSTASILGHPIHPMLVPLPIACFVGALFTDIAYAETYDVTWLNFSDWLLAAAMAFGVLAAIPGIVDFTKRRVRAQRPAWPHAIGNAVALLLGLANNFVHSRDAYKAVVPTGLTLSILTVLVLGVTAWLGGSLVYKHRVGVQG